MSGGEVVHFTPDVADFVVFAAVEALSVGQYNITDDVFLCFIEVPVGQRLPVFLRFFSEFLFQGGHDHLLEFFQATFAGILVGGGTCQCVDVVFYERFNAGLERLIFRNFRQWSLHQRRFAYHFSEPFLSGDLRLDRFVSNLQGFDKIFLLTFVSLTFHHGNVVFGGCHDEIHVGVFQIRTPGVDDKLAINTSNTNFREQSFHRDITYRDGCRARQSGERIGHSFLVGRDKVDNYLRLVHVPVGEQRAKCAVNQTADEYLVIGQTSLPAEEVSRDTSDGSELFLIINREREEWLVFLGFPGAYHGAEEHGVAMADQHGTVGLSGQLTRFKRDLTSIRQVERGA